MSLIIDETTISTTQSIKFDGVNIDKIVFDGTTVWQKYIPTWKVIWTGEERIGKYQKGTVYYDAYVLNLRAGALTRIDASGGVQGLTLQNSWTELPTSSGKMYTKNPTSNNSLPFKMVNDNQFFPAFIILMKVEQYI